MIVNDFELIQTMHLNAKLKTENSPIYIYTSKMLFFETCAAMISVQSLELRLGALNCGWATRITTRLPELRLGFDNYNDRPYSLITVDKKESV